ncbi:hypothetical protein J1N35_038668 [Gossypium stocksii]|uniref:Aminotransferase-like plant mobile domain-containing protein n=1 Tax=Gossypium stocksii TaxID=47602 RepID=A0A9D3ZMT7_9ROSI|nr:hypothetical protein J1N35_038668 [Gossypium stocksii]
MSAQSSPSRKRFVLTWTKRSPGMRFARFTPLTAIFLTVGTLNKRWRPETHTFHLSCGQCTITLEDVQLQLGLPVEGYAVTGSAQSTDWGVVCYELLGTIQDNINGGQIEMGWLRDTFPESDNDSTELERIRYARAYILEIIGGYLMSDLSQNLEHLR